MAKQRDPQRDAAKQIFDDARGGVTNREIAQRLGVDERKVAVWKQRDGWDVVQQKRVVQQKKRDRKTAQQAAENKELTEPQRAFCLHYVKSFNATRAYMAAFGCSYSSAHAHGYALLARPNIQAEIRRLRELRNTDIMADVTDLVQLHMRIAFADITDFVEFGHTPGLFSGNDVRFREHTDVDGQLISEVKVSKEGASIKLVDRQKSLDFLERYFSANPMDEHRKKYDDAKLELERLRLNAQAAPGEVVQIIDDV